MSTLTADKVMCASEAYMLLDSCAEPVEIVRFPAVDPTKLVSLETVAANDGQLLVNKVNVVSSTIVKNTLLPATAAEGDIFSVVNSTPQDVTIKVAAADTSSVATLRPGSVLSLRYIGGKWASY